MAPMFIESEFGFKLPLTIITPPFKPELVIDPGIVTLIPLLVPPVTIATPEPKFTFIVADEFEPLYDASTTLPPF